MPSFPPAAQTVGITSAVIPSGPQIQEDEVCRVSIHVFASDHGSGQAYWEFRILLRRMIGNVTSGVVAQLVHNNSGAAATWVASVAITESQAQVTVTGALGVTVDWLALSDDPLCMVGAFVS